MKKLDSWLGGLFLHFQVLDVFGYGHQGGPDSADKLLKILPAYCGQDCIFVRRKRPLEPDYLALNLNMAVYYPSDWAP